MHWWEQISPRQILYESWTREHWRKLDVASWVEENSEKVTALRDKVTLEQVVSDARKRNPDKHSVVRRLAVED